MSVAYVNCNNRKVGKPGNEARLYALTRAVRTHAHSHTHTHTSMHSHTFMHAHTLAHSLAHTLAHSLAHTLAHKHTRVHESTLLHHSCSGVVDVFGVDDSTGMWLLSHTLQFTRRQFPGKQIPAMCSACFKFQHSINDSDSNDSNSVSVLDPISIPPSSSLLLPPPRNGCPARCSPVYYLIPSPSPLSRHPPPSS